MCTVEDLNKEFGALEELHIQNNHIGDLGVLELAKAIPRST
jgi:hypothetical protein